MSFEKNLRNLLERFGSVARTQITGSSVSDYMVDSPNAVGRNENKGIGTLRRITGALSRTLLDLRNPESVYEVNFSGNSVKITIGSEKVYAAIHEFGFTGQVSIPAHTRTITQAFGREIAPTQVNVSSYMRDMNIPARPYLAPAIDAKSEWMFRWLEENGATLLTDLDEE